MSHPRDPELQDFVDTELRARLQELEGTRIARLFMLFGIIVLTAAVMVAGAGFFGFSIIGGPDAFTAFAIGLGASSGLGILVVVLAYLMVVRTHLHQQLQARLLVPLFRQLFSEFTYDANDSVPEALWRESELFDDSAELRRAGHLVTTRMDSTEIRFCRLHLEPSMSAPSESGDRRRHFDGIFLAATGDDDAVCDGESLQTQLAASDDAPKFDVNTETSTLFLALDTALPRPRTNPFRPVVDEATLRRFVHDLEFGVTAVKKWREGPPEHR